MSDSLVVVSKIKKHIKNKSGLNTSSSVMEKLTELVDQECDKAIDNAKRANRKTVMNRDFHFN